MFSVFLSTKDKISQALRISILVMASIALTAEILPEVKAKLIVVPTLILIIAVIIIDLKRGKKYKVVDRNFDEK